MIGKSIQKHLTTHGCKVSETSSQAIDIDCNDFKISKQKGLPWYILLPYPPLNDINPIPPFPTKKVSVGFWENHARWGKMKDLKISDEVFIDLTEDELQTISDPRIDSLLKRIDKLRAFQNQSTIKNIDVKKSVEDNIHQVGQNLAEAAEEAYEARSDVPVVCEPETILMKKWLPTRGTTFQYTVNIICGVPNFSALIHQKLQNLGNWEIIQTRKRDFVRSIFPVKNEVYLNEIIFHGKAYPDPYISMIFDKKLLKNPTFVPKIRSILKKKDFS